MVPYKEIYHDTSPSLQVLELIAPLPTKANKKAEERKKFATARQQQQLQQQQQPQQRRFSQGSNGNGNNNSNNGNNNSVPMPRRKIGVFGNPKFSPIVEEQNVRAEGLNPNSASFQTQQQQQRKNSRSNQNAAQGTGAGNGTDAAGISAWMTRRISGGQLEYTRSGTMTCDFSRRAKQLSCNFSNVKMVLSFVGLIQPVLLPSS